MQFENSAWKIGKMLKHVHGYGAVEIAVVIWCPLLTGGCGNGYFRVALLDFGGHVFPKLNTMVVLTGKILEFNMAADTSTDLYRPKMTLIGKVSQRIVVVEFFDRSVSIRKDLMPEMHPVIGNSQFAVAERRR